MTRGARAIFGLLIVAAVVELPLLHGCGQGGTGGGSGGAGSGSSLPPAPVPLLALSANPETVVVSASAGGTSDLTVQLADRNTHLPLAGIPVSFFASGGKLASATAASDHNGVATDSLNVAAGAPDSSLTVSAHAHGGGQSLSLTVANLSWFHHGAGRQRQHLDTAQRHDELRPAGCGEPNLWPVSRRLGWLGSRSGPAAIGRWPRC